jgi:hypothetical protein
MIGVNLFFDRRPSAMEVLKLKAINIILGIFQNLILLEHMINGSGMLKLIAFI